MSHTVPRAITTPLRPARRGAGSPWSVSWTGDLSLEGGGIRSSRSPPRRDGPIRTAFLWG